MQPKVMIVEDESIIALNLQRRLSRLGYDVTYVAASHDQAIKGYRETEPDIVLMDVNISGDIDGIDTAAEINAPVIFLTAYSEERTLERAKAVGPYGYLVKPFSERELHATLQMALERRRAEKRLGHREQSLAIAYAKLEESKLELEASAAALAREKEQLQVTLNSMGDGVITTDSSGHVTYLNPLAEAMTGWPLDEARGRPSSQVLVLIDAETRQPIPCPIETLLRRGDASVPAENWLMVAKNGSTCAIEDSVAPIHDHQQKVIGAVLVFHDASDTRRMTEEIAYQATHDTLTGLVNRREFERRVEKLMVSAEIYGQQHVLAYLDLDKFKIVNDTCGHSAGDELLRQVTGLMRLQLRADDTLARLSGDEFGLLLESCPLDVALRIAENIRHSIDDFDFAWDGKVFSIGVSVGVVNFGCTSEDDSPLNLAALMSAADSACYTAKNLGRNRVHLYRPRNQAQGGPLGAMDWHGRIRRAIDENGFVLQAQKIASLHDGQAGHMQAEVLLNLQDRDGQLIPPDTFIPIAERYGLMVEVDRWVISRILAHMGSCSEESPSLFSINISAASLADDRTLPFIAEQLRSFQVYPSVICLEISEHAAMAHLPQASAFMAEAHAIGCKVALDDFGRGASSFDSLKRLPADYLKIDGRTVRDIVSDKIKRTVVVAIKDVAHLLGMKVIAKSVESEEILAVLREMGLDYAQGYSIARPIPLVADYTVDNDS